MAKTKTSIGQHSRLTRRARHLLSLLRKTRVHSVRQAILRELHHEFDRMRRGVRRTRRAAGRAGSRSRRLWAKTREAAHHLNNRRKHGATLYDHAGREIRSQHDQRAYTLRHRREADAAPRERDGKQDGRTPREKLKDNLGDRLEAMGHEVPGRESAPSRGKDTGPVSYPREWRDHDRGEDNVRRTPPAGREADSRQRADEWDRNSRDAGWYSGQWREDHLVDRAPRDLPEPEAPAPRAARADARLDPTGGPPMPSEDIGRIRPARDGNGRFTRTAR